MTYITNPLYKLGAFLIFLYLSINISFANDICKKDINYDIAYWNLYHPFRDRFDVVKRKAKNGDKFHQYFLGHFYRNGYNVEKNTEQAIYWLEKAASQGIIDAYAGLGQIYLKNREFILAKKNLDCAFKHNDKTAAFTLGYIYYVGKGVKKDIKRAIDLFNFAINKGFKQGHDMLVAIYLFPENEDKKYYDKKLGLYHLHKSVEFGSDISRFVLGKIYLEGKLIDKDSKKGLNLIKISADNGYEDAKEFLKCKALNSKKSCD